MLGSVVAAGREVSQRRVGAKEPRPPARWTARADHSFRAHGAALRGRRPGLLRGGACWGWWWRVGAEEPRPPARWGLAAKIGHRARRSRATGGARPASDGAHSPVGSALPAGRRLGFGANGWSSPMSSATLAAQPRWLAFESAASIAGCGDTHARVAGVLRWAGGIVDWTLDRHRWALRTEARSAGVWRRGPHPA